jgi:AmmeMemoRadiSam system protein B
MKWINHEGQRLLMLRDPRHVAEHVALLPPEAAYALSLCDGTRDLPQVASDLVALTGLRVSTGWLAQLVDQLDEALMLDSPRYSQAVQELLAVYRSASYRDPALAGVAYPTDAMALSQLLDGFMARLPRETEQPDSHIRGLLSPHIDFQRGGATYAHVWRSARDAVRAADVVIIFGTDHAGGPGTVTFTRQHYTSPFGILPTDQAAIDEVQTSVGSQIFDEELHHRHEHAIELAAVWLQYIRGGPVALIPVLVGSFHPFTNGDAEPSAHHSFEDVVAALRRATAGRSTLVVTAGDLAHVGPEFGDVEPLDSKAKRALRIHDERLLRTLCTGNPEGFFALLHESRDEQRICGLPPTYLALRMLGSSSGRVVAYDQCSADPVDTSVVSVAGVVFR